MAVSDTDVAKLTAEVAELKRLLTEERAGSERVREKAFDQLYVELKQYKDEFLFQAERPLLLDLLLFYDSLNWFQLSLVKKELSPDVIAESFQYMIDEFLEVLYRRDVVPFEQTAQFDKQRQKAVKVIDTDDRGADQTVAQVLRRGFLRAEKPLRVEEVVIQRWKGDKA
ncbi:MAG: nucleotide exchange factor GrpE [Deltaproteobacteria bacterium]|nr:nucleotide exchange factor GrpE [Deltaproteobacteria bacterium]